MNESAATNSGSTDQSSAGAASPPTSAGPIPGAWPRNPILSAAGIIGLIAAIFLGLAWLYLIYVYAINFPNFSTVLRAWSIVDCAAGLLAIALLTIASVQLIRHNRSAIWLLGGWAVLQIGWPVLMLMAFAPYREVPVSIALLVVAFLVITGAGGVAGSLALCTVWLAPPAVAGWFLIRRDTRQSLK